MNKIAFILAMGMLLALVTAIPSCSSNCVDEVLLQTTRMDLRVNAENLGISTIAPKNSPDTIRSETSQFYNYPEFRRFGQRIRPSKDFSLITSAYAQEDCPEQTDYISRMDPAKTTFSLNIDYDASAVGQGTITAGTDLLGIQEINDSYLQDFTNNIFLNGGAPTPLTINKNFFLPVNDRWVTFYFTFEEIDGTAFADSTVAFVNIEF